MPDISGILRAARGRNASDVHVIAGSPVLFRVGGELVAAGRQILGSEETKELCYSLLKKEEIEKFEGCGDFDLVTSFGRLGRCRVNIAYNLGDVGATIRLLPGEPMSLEKLNLPPVASQITGREKGLVLLTGSTSAGKSTSMAAILDAINRTSARHIITIEDPIEYVFTNKKSVVRQRDVGHDTASFSRALRAALRQDPDVIAIGEMRDFETIKIALTAADTGVLVISTLHVMTVDKILDRFFSYAPEGQEGHLRALLSETLLCVIHQELLPTVDGGKRVACETLVVTDAVRNLLRKANTYHLRSMIATGKRHGMQSMNASLADLRSQGLITQEVHDAVAANYP